MPTVTGCPCDACRESEREREMSALELERENGMSVSENGDAVSELERENGDAPDAGEGDAESLCAVCGESESECECGECDACGDTTAHDDLSEVQCRRGSESWCESCRDSDARECDDCSDTISDTADYGSDGRHLCHDCASNYFDCAQCGEQTHESNSVSLESGDSICESCYTAHYFTCRECDTVCSDDDESDTRRVCSQCAQSMEPVSILPYGAQPDAGLTFLHTVQEFAHSQRTGARLRYFGMELECESGGRGESPDEVARAAQDASAGMFYACHDGSISNGFEFISHPTTLDYWRDALAVGGRAENGVSVIRRAGFKSHYTQTCGLHLHASRNTISALTIYKLTEFARANESYILRVSRRAPANLNTWASPHASESRQEMSAKLKYAAHYNRASYACSSRRYTAFNLTPHTVECRIFRGTLKRETIAGAVQWYDALLEYLAVSSLRACTDSNALDEFIAARASEYPDAARSKFYAGAHARPSYHPMNNPLHGTARRAEKVSV